MILHSFPEKFQFKNPVVTVGTFDGVHKGHLEVIRFLKKIASEVNGETVIVTLWPHPRIVLGKTDHHFSLLNTINEKIKLLELAGVDHLIVIPFTFEFSQQSSSEFIKNVLVDAIGTKHLLMGDNNHYGRNREGDFQSISDYAKIYNFSIYKSDIIQMDGNRISSTIIRNFISAGDMIETEKHLGYSYMLTGTVIEGDKVGRTLGYPTANIEPNDSYKQIPPDGIYAVIVTVENQQFGGMLYIGNRPTLRKLTKTKNIEVHLFNFAADIYGKELTLRFIEKTRDDMKFNNLELLTRQLDKDKETVLEIIKNKK